MNFLSKSFLLCLAIAVIGMVAASPLPQEEEANQKPSSWMGSIGNAAWSGVSMAGNMAATVLKPITKRALQLAMKTEAELRHIMNTSMTAGFKEMRQDIVGALWGGGKGKGQGIDKNEAAKIEQEVEKELNKEGADA